MISNTLEHLQFGDHFCMPVGQAADQRTFAVGFTRDGLRDGQKVFLAVTDPDPLREHLVEQVPEAVGAMARGQVEVVSAREAYFGPGTFSAERLIDQFGGIMADASRDGYAGTRVIGDLSALQPAIPTEVLLDYESRVHSIYTEHDAFGFCQYDIDALGAQTWQRLTSVHPCALSHTGDAAISRLRGRRTVAGMRLTGEADIVNRAAFPNMLKAAEEYPDAFEIDASQLEFADGRAIACLVRTAARRAPLRTTIVCGPHLATMLTAFGAGDIPHLTLTDTNTEQP